MKMRAGIRAGLVLSPRISISRLDDSAIDVSKAPGSVIGFVDRARPSVAPIAIEAAAMTGEAVCDASTADTVHMG